MDSAYKKKLIEYLLPKISENKQQKMRAVLENRTRHVTVVLEDVFQPHNSSAIVRSAECFGVQDLHIIQNRFNFTVTAGIAMGSSKWLDIHKYHNVQETYAHLKNQGYTIVATCPDENAYFLHELPLDKKIALVFGTEQEGLTEYALSNADARVKIPMVGFTQSYNVSVSVALSLYDLTQRLRSSPVAWQLSENEQLDIALTWLKRSIRGSQHFVELFEKQVQNS